MRSLRALHEALSKKVKIGAPDILCENCTRLPFVGMQLEVDPADPSKLFLHQAPYTQTVLDRFQEDMENHRKVTVPASHASINQDVPIDGPLAEKDMKVKNRTQQILGGHHMDQHKGAARPLLCS